MIGSSLGARVDTTHLHDIHLPFVSPYSRNNAKSGEIGTLLLLRPNALAHLVRHK